jgi:hypothetical protein
LTGDFVELALLIVISFSPKYSGNKFPTLRWFERVLSFAGARKLIIKLVNNYKTPIGKWKKNKEKINC